MHCNKCDEWLQGVVDDQNDITFPFPCLLFLSSVLFTKMSARKVKLMLRKNFGNQRNFIIWVVLLVIVLYLVNLYTENEEPIKTPYIRKTVSTSHIKHAVNSKCDSGITECSKNFYSFFITSGEGTFYHPTICFNGNFIFDVDKNNSRRGLNVAVINDKTLEVEDIRIFDTYHSDAFFKTYFLSLIPSNFVVLIASFDDISYNLSDESKVLLESFGSNSIKQVKFRDSFVMIGQKHLKRGHAVEKLLSQDDILHYAQRAEIKGCVKVPVGELESMGKKAIREKKSQYKKGEALINCGVSDVCDDTSFSFHAYTGNGGNDTCKLCINGKYVFAKNLNNAGRGFNVAVVSPITRDVIRIGVFDTYASDGSNAEIFLEMLNDRDIVIVVTYDDASRMLTVNVQKFFEDLGSVMINRLSFRDLWVFVGQKGITGASPIEKMNRAGGKFPESFDMRMCVPIHLEGIKTNKNSIHNTARMKFCQDHKGILSDQFCADENRLKLFEPATFAHTSNHILNDIYRTPIIIMPGSNYRAFESQMDSLLRNPGIRLDMINLIHSSKYNLYTELAEAYGVRAHSIFTSQESYAKFFPEAFRRAWSLYINENHMIFLEQEVITTSDFLSFLARATNTNYYIDNSLVGISTWNPYGGDEGIAGVWYRSNSLIPGIGFLMKRLFYMNYLKDVFVKCCSGKPWLGWKVLNVDDKEMIIPSVSRSYRLPIDASEAPKDYDWKIGAEIFNRNQSLNNDFRVELETPKLIMVHKYDYYVTQLITYSLQYQQVDVQACIQKGVPIPATTLSQPEKKGIDRYSIYYEQQSADDKVFCLLIARCFNYFPIPHLPSPYFRDGVLRLTYHKAEVFLVGSLTAAFRLKATSTIIYKIASISPESLRAHEHKNQTEENLVQTKMLGATEVENSHQSQSLTASIDKSASSIATLKSNVSSAT